ncbi:hypothetical protein BC940DRAFT_289496 [Gongronella butleri]|nr:hypothetical protein BC940DRAFT_289496 [Gongronella butleri]
MAWLDNYAASHCTHTPENDDLEHHMAEKHLEHLLDTLVKPLFPATSVSLRHGRVRHTNSKAATPLDDWQPAWKSASPSPVDVLAWAVEKASPMALEHALPSVIPPLLRVLDDHDVDYKLRAVRILNTLIDKLPERVIRQYGLDNVWNESLFKCLMYMTDDRDLPLLEAAYACLLALICKTNAPQTQARADLLRKVLTDCIVRGLTYAGDKAPYLTIFVHVLDTLVIELGPAIVPYFKVCLDAVSHGTQSVRTRLNLDALALLKHLMEIAWPRVPAHASDILEILVKLWLRRQQEPGSDEVCEQTKQLYKMLHAIGSKQLEIDVQALLEMDASTLSPLLVP